MLWRGLEIIPKASNWVLKATEGPENGCRGTSSRQRERCQAAGAVCAHLGRAAVSAAVLSCIAGSFFSSVTARASCDMIKQEE